MNNPVGMLIVFGFILLFVLACIAFELRDIATSLDKLLSDGFDLAITLNDKR